MTTVNIAVLALNLLTIAFSIAALIVNHRTGKLLRQTETRLQKVKGWRDDGKGKS